MVTTEILGVQHAYELTEPTKSPFTLIFIHGWLLSRAYWQPLIERLAADYQCLSYDLRGFGQSQIDHEVETENQILLPSSSDVNLNCEAELIVSSNDLDAASSTITADYTPAAYAQDLEILLQKLNITSGWLIGHSLGGTIALWAAARMPDRIKGAICINAGGGIYLKEAFEQFRYSGQQLLKFRPRWLCQLPLIDLVFTRANVTQAIARSWGRQRVIDFVMASPEAALGSLLNSTTEEEINRLPQLVSQLQQPVYFITGTNDRIMEPKYVRHLASFHSLFETCGSNVIEIPDCGHLAMLEQPDTVATLITSLLVQHQEV